VQVGEWGVAAACNAAAGVVEQRLVVPDMRQIPTGKPWVGAWRGFAQSQGSASGTGSRRRVMNGEIQKLCDQRQGITILLVLAS
jgi:hypothetical protein